MPKVVYNGCFGGFGLSDKAKGRLLELKGVSEEELDIYEVPRHDPDLVNVVEALGEEADGYCADLCIAEIEGNMYIIDEYDGNEHVVVPDDINWIKI